MTGCLYSGFSNKIIHTKYGRSSVKTIIVGCLCVIILYVVVKFEQIREHGDFSSLDFPDELFYEPLRNIPDDFEKLAASSKVKIPKIIHQTWKSEKIPQQFVSYVKTWADNHPDWTYMLWTDASAKRLIADRYNEFLPVFISYSENIRRADALRYFVLYEYGGVYVDMDMESLKPLDDMVDKYSCFLSQEPYEHPVLDGGFEHLILNALMGCRKEHPFMKHIMDQLAFFSHMWHVLDSTGPYFITALFKQYIKINNNMKAEDAVYITPPDYFFPTVDPIKFFYFHVTCRKFSELSVLQKRGCVSMKRRGKKQRIPATSYSDHHWIHTYIYTLRERQPVVIHDIIPKVTIY